MAALQYVANSTFQSGTLGSSYTSGGGSLVLTGGQGARFPSSGDFWVRVQTSLTDASDAEIFKVTARSTDTLTVTGAQDGTSAQNHASGSIVVWVLGVAALNQLKADIIAGGSSGALVLLQSQTASSSASLEFTSTIVSTYDTYQFEFVNVLPATDGVTLNIQVSTDGGSTWVTSASYTWGAFRFSGLGSASSGASGATAIVLADTNTIANDAPYGLVGMIQLFSPGSSSVHKAINGNITFKETLGVMIGQITMGSYDANTAINAVRFLMSSGNIASGTIRSYGITKP